MSPTGSSRKSPPAPSLTANLQGATHWLLSGSGRWIAWPAIAVVVASAGLWMLWRNVRDDLAGSSAYRVMYDQVQVTPPPAWVRSNLTREALRDASLDEPLSLLDPRIADRIASAFALHPWVAEVVRVVPRYPGTVAVELRYRRPVCMVELPEGYYPIDADAVLLPTTGFTTAETRDYPRLAGAASVPLAPAGTRWENSHVVGGAKLAAVLIDHWKAWQLALIEAEPAGDQPSASDVPSYCLVTKAGARVHWGHAPGSETSAEPPADKKMNRLASWISQQGTSAKSTGGDALDLRIDTPQTVPHTATLPSAN